MITWLFCEYYDYIIIRVEIQWFKNMILTHKLMPFLDNDTSVFYGVYYRNIVFKENMKLNNFLKLKKKCIRMEKLMLFKK